MIKFSIEREFDPKIYSKLLNLEKGEMLFYHSAAYKISENGEFMVCNLNIPKNERKWEIFDRKEYIEMIFNSGKN